MTIRSQRRSLRFLPLALLTALLAACGRGVLDPHGPIAAAEKVMLFNSLAIMLAVVIPTIVATLGFAWWFRAGNERARYQPTWTYSGQIEMVVWAIPAMVVMLLAGGVVWVGTHRLDPPRPLDSATPPLVVEVVSLDWKWLFIYPELGIASVNRLVVPVGTPISFHLTSATVMNSFFVPQLGSQIYAMAGMETRLNLQADQPGNYRGMSAQLSGEGFSDMRFEVDARPRADFDAWLVSVRAAVQAPALDPASYAALAKPSKAVGPFDYRSVAPNLFAAVLDPNAGSTSRMPRPTLPGASQPAAAAAPPASASMPAMPAMQPGG